MSDGSASSGQAAAGDGQSGQASQAAAQATTTQQSTPGTQTAETAEVSEVAAKAADVDSEVNQEVAETKQEKELHALYKKIQEKHKDRKFEKDSDYLDLAHEEIDGLEKYRDENVKSNEKIISLFESNPELADIIKDMDKGASFIEALARNVDMDSITPLDDEPDYDKWNLAKKERMDKLNSRKAFEKDFDSNIQKSVQVFADFGKEKGWDKVKANEFTGKIDNVMAELSKGVISKGFLSMMDKALNYDQDVSEAMETGEIKGKNMAIEAKRHTPEKTGDGIPSVAATGESEVDTPQQKTTVDVFSRAVLRANERQERAFGKNK